MTHLSVIQLPHDILLAHPAALSPSTCQKQTLSLNKLPRFSVIPVLQHKPVFKTIMRVRLQHLPKLTQTHFLPVRPEVLSRLEIQCMLMEIRDAYNVQTKPTTYVSLGIVYTCAAFLKYVKLTTENGSTAQN